MRGTGMLLLLIVGAVLGVMVVIYTPLLSFIEGLREFFNNWWWLFLIGIILAFAWFLFGGVLGARKKWNDGSRNSNKQKSKPSVDWGEGFSLKNPPKGGK